MSTNPDDRARAYAERWPYLINQARTDYSYYNGCPEHVYGCPKDCPDAPD